MVERFCAGAKEDASMGAIRNVLSLYRAACHYGDPATHDDEDGSRLRIASDAAFQRILVFTLSEADTFFRRLLSLSTCPGTTIPAAALKSPKCASGTFWRSGSLSHGVIELFADGHQMHAGFHLLTQPSLVQVAESGSSGQVILGEHTAPPCTPCRGALVNVYSAEAACECGIPGTFRDADQEDAQARGRHVWRV